MTPLPVLVAGKWPARRFQAPVEFALVGFEPPRFAPVRVQPEPGRPAAVPGAAAPEPMAPRPARCAHRLLRERETPGPRTDQCRGRSSPATAEASVPPPSPSAFRHPACLPCLHRVPVPAHPSALTVRLSDVPEHAGMVPVGTRLGHASGHLAPPRSRCGNIDSKMPRTPMGVRGIEGVQAVLQSAASGALTLPAVLRRYVPLRVRRRCP